MDFPQVSRHRRSYPLAPLAAAALLCLGAAPALYAQEADAGTGADKMLPRVDVVGSGPGVQKAPGSAAVIDSRTLEESRVFNVNEALRKVPGVHVREEEGVGLRPNIGIRGMNPTRSTKTLLLEDGLPLSFAPYGDNASYYHPPIDRYDSIEVSKGSQVIRFGPQTAGGVINYITPEPQRELGGFVGLAGGSRGYLNGHVMVTGNGAIADIYHKQSDGARDSMHSRLDDVNFKWAGQLNDDHKLVLRATHFREHSQLTYSGLTQAEYEKLGPRYNPFKNDFFDANRTGLSATHQWRLDADSKVLTSIYGAYFDRDWWRQASTTTGSLSCNDGATANSGKRAAGISLDNADLQACRFEGRLRTYTTTGVDSRIFQRHSALGISGELEAGVKYQHEIQRRRQENFTSYSLYQPGATPSSIGEDQRRTTDAFTGFVSNRFQFTDALAVTPIVRIEHIRHRRELLQSTATGNTARTTFTEVIPGVGATYALNDKNIVFAGVHRGFSPPRVEDSLYSSSSSNSGANGTVTSVDVGAERSVNAELGIRSTVSDDSRVEIAYFRNNFSNLVQVGSIAGGTTAYSEGSALIEGVEAAGQFDRLAKPFAGDLFSRVSLTYIPTAKQTTYFKNVGDHGANTTIGAVGNRLPYSPETMLTVTLGYRAPTNWNARIEYVYVGEQYADFANTVDVAGSNLSNANKASGQYGVIDAYGIWNAVANYTVGKATFFIAGKNLGDKTYIVDRTRGIQVGMPRTFQAGLKYAF